MPDVGIDGAAMDTEITAASLTEYSLSGIIPVRIACKSIPEIILLERYGYANDWTIR